MKSLMLMALLFVAEGGESPSELNDQALAQAEQGNLDAAIRLLEQAGRAAPDDPTLRRNLAILHNNRGLALLNQLEYGRAIHDFEQAIALDDADALFRVHLGYAHLLRFDLVRAEQVLLEGRRRFPQDPRVLDRLGFVYYVRDDLERAIAAWQERLELAADDWASGQLDKALREKAVSGDFIDRTSNDFTIKFLGSAGNLAQADEMLHLLEDARAKVCGDLGFYPLQRTTVLLYDSQAEFKRATGSHAWVGGLYDGKIRLPVGNFDRQRDSVARTARHEYTHRVLHELVPECPIWLNEGLAEWFEDGDDFDAHAAMIGLVRDGGEVPSFAAMPKTFAGQPDAAVVTRQYAASQSFVAFLRERHGLGAMRALLLGLRRAEPVDDALRRSFGSTLAELETLWQREVLSR